MKTYLSKSRYTKYCQCAKALWLSVNKPEEATVDAGVEARFAEGNVVGDLSILPSLLQATAVPLAEHWQRRYATTFR